MNTIRMRPSRFLLAPREHAAGKQYPRMERRACNRHDNTYSLFSWPSIIFRLSMSLGWKSFFLCPWHSSIIASNKGANTSYDSLSPATIPDARCHGTPGLSTPTWMAWSRVKPLAVVRCLHVQMLTSEKQKKNDILMLTVVIFRGSKDKVKFKVPLMVYWSLKY